MRRNRIMKNIPEGFPVSKLEPQQDQSDLDLDDSRRSKLQILIDILRLIHRKGGVAKPTHILYGANLSHVRMSKYLNWLLMQTFIEEIDVGGRGAFRITEKGYAFMKEFKKIEQFSEAFGISI